MADVHISDHIVYNILARVPAESLLRFKCVSKHWNSLIKDPYLMKLRSRRMILLSCKKGLIAIYDNVHVEGTTIIDDVTLSGRATIVGTFNGIVLLLLDKDMCHQLILYNPFTRASKMLPNLPSHYNWSWKYTFGFGYGATMDDMKIVRIYNDQKFDDCDVFSFKNSSWEEIKDSNIQGIGFRHGDVGKFLNGFLYWIGYSRLNKLVIVALNVTNMVLSKINPPVQFSNKDSPLGTIDGCLCMIDKCDDMGFNVWVMKEQGVESSWTKTWSFPLSIQLEGYCFSKLYPVCILDSGRILIMGLYSYNLIIYYTLNGSFKKLNLPEELQRSVLWDSDGIEYMESLVSPSNLCFV